MTNRSWQVSGAALSQQFGIGSVTLINDFVAAGYGLLTLDWATEVVVINAAERSPGAPMCAIGQYLQLYKLGHVLLQLMLLHANVTSAAGKLCVLACGAIPQRAHVDKRCQFAVQASLRILRVAVVLKSSTTVSEPLHSRVLHCARAPPAALVLYTYSTLSCTCYKQAQLCPAYASHYLMDHSLCCTALHCRQRHRSWTDIPYSASWHY
jgi:Glucokinase